MNREYHKWRSPHLDRDMELLVFGHAGAKVVVFPTRRGRFYEYEKMGVIEALGLKIGSGDLQLYCIDGLDRETFYARGKHPRDRIARHLAYERYVLEEVVPFMDGKNPHSCRIAHGCSLGAFFAASLCFRHPHYFRKLAAFSGRYDLSHPIEHFDDLLDGHRNQEVYFLMPNQFLPRLTRPDILSQLRRIDLLFLIGGEDPFLESNVFLSDTLRSKEVGHRLEYFPGRAHDPASWQAMAAHFL